jgi:hypothetical protein
MTVTFTLTSGSSGTAAGPFNISGTTSGGGLNGVSIATGVTKNQLSTGHTISGISELITGGTIASTGTCTTTTPWSVTSATPTPTPSPTPTATPTTSYQYAISQMGSETRLDACNDFINFLPDEVFAAEFQSSNVTQFFTDSGLTQQFGGDGGYYCFRRDVDSDSQRVSAQIGPNGYPTTAIQTCFG